MGTVNSHHNYINKMNIIIALSCLLAIAAAAPTPEGDSSAEHIAILRDDRDHSDDGTYSFDMETENGISRSEKGYLIDVGSSEEVIAQAGSYSFTFPNGESFEMTFVADQNGFQPQSDHLPVAPAFPHPIPEFVLEQIEFARQQDEEDK